MVGCFSGIPKSDGYATAGGHYWWVSGVLSPNPLSLGLKWFLAQFSEVAF